MCAMSDDGVKVLMLNIFSPLTLTEEKRNDRVKLQCPEYPILERTFGEMDENLAG